MSFEKGNQYLRCREFERLAPHDIQVGESGGEGEALPPGECRGSGGAQPPHHKGRFVGA